VVNSKQTLFALTNVLQPVRRAWVQAVGRALSDTGVPTPLATAVLLVARLGSSAHQKDLAAALGVNPAGMVRIIDQGEAAGLLARSSATNDRRAKVVVLLPAGQRLAERCEDVVVGLRQELLGDLALADVENATRILRLLEERAQVWALDNR
jgi:MarR family transcriptional regulator, transcriptional regulator for hemolysin